MQFVRIHRRFPYTALSPIGAHCVPMGLNPYREIVFRSIFQIAGARTVNRLFSPFSDVRKKKGLRIFRRLFHADAQNWFFVVLLRGLLRRGGVFYAFLFLLSASGPEPGARRLRRGSRRPRRRPPAGPRPRWCRRSCPWTCWSGSPRSHRPWPGCW